LQRVRPIGLREPFSTICFEVTSVIGNWTLNELAVLEAAKRGLARSGRGRRFDPAVFEAVAGAELETLRQALSATRSNDRLDVTSAFGQSRH
jgi:hypothetical protein